MKKVNILKTKPFQLLLLAVLLLPIIAGVTPYIFASGETISSSNSFTTQINTAAPINDIVINGTGNSVIPVKLLVGSGTLAMSTTTGLTFTGSPTGSTLYFSGTRSDVNAALATLTYTRASLGSDTLEISLVNPGEVFFSGTGHLYEYVSATLTWNGAKPAAEARSKYGATGYLTTITSQAENDFVAARLTNAGWMGASDITTESVWKWVTGPENGTTFSNGNSPSMTTAPGQYQNWNSGEPNDAGGEDCGQFLAGGSGQWNDLPCASSTLPGYVVEYGATGNMPSVAAKNISLTTTDTVAPSNPGTPSTTSPTANQKPTWTWSASSDGGVGLANPAYSLQWSQSSTFASGVSTATTNSTSYTHSVNLADGTWYFRVRASDSSGNTSSYSANGTVVVDSTGPSAPTLSFTSLKTHSTTPTLTWSASTDSGSGLANPIYTVQRSQSSTFASGITSATTNSNTSFTPSTMTDGTWYVRVRAADQLGNVSAWSTTANVLVDTASPTTPGAPSTASPTNNKKPTWTWAASTDSGAGLASPAYIVQWSQSSTFASGITSATTNSTSYTQPSDLVDGTWYFRILASDDAGNNSSYSAVSSVVIDSTPAAVSSILATPNGSTGQTITWTTDKLASSKILYGPTTTYDSTTTEADTSPRVVSHTVQLTGLTSCTLYHYQLVSTDAVGNQANSSDVTFITTGCAGSAAVTGHADAVVTAVSGGTISLPVGTSNVKIDVPANFSSFNADFQIKQIDPVAALAVIGGPLDLKPVGKAYDLKAMKDTTTPISSFTNDVTVTLPYGDDDISTLIESSLVIYHWNSTIGWQRLTDCHVNTTARTVTCDTSGFSTFVLFGTPKPAVAAPVAQVTAAATKSLTSTVRSFANAITDDSVGDDYPVSADYNDTTDVSNGQSSGGTSTQSEPEDYAVGTTKNSTSAWWWIFATIVLLSGFFILAAKRRRKSDDQGA